MYIYIYIDIYFNICIICTYIYIHIYIYMYICTKTMLLRGGDLRQIFRLNTFFNRKSPPHSRILFRKSQSCAQT